MQEVQIQKAKIHDLEDLVKMARESFLESFREGNKIENVMAYLEEAFTINQFKDEFQNEASTFFIAKKDVHIIGYCKVNLVPAQTDIQDPESLEIARLYVLKAYLGLGLGKRLLDHAESYARSLGKKYMWLGVWEHNKRAIRFYEKNGLEKFSSHPFPFGDEVQTDFLMKKEF